MPRREEAMSEPFDDPTDAKLLDRLRRLGSAVEAPPRAMTTDDVLIPEFSRDEYQDPEDADEFEPAIARRRTDIAGDA
jgi:hypothetical protein